MAPGRNAVLVVDDEAIVRFVAVSLFEDLGFEVLEADEGQKALEVLDQRPDIALLFTDCRMPGMSGPELARAALARYPQLKVVLVSGYVDTVANGAWPLIAKPYRETDLEQVVSRELGALG